MITLQIPTMNRPEFLERLLEYYAAANYRYTLFIGDSSDEERAARCQSLAQAYGRRMNIQYQHYPKAGIGACFKRMSLATTTPFVAALPDDDFILPKGIEQAVAFLESHPDYNAAHGQAVCLTLKDSGPWGQIDTVGSYFQRSVESETAADRIVDHMRSYHVALFGIHRTPAWQAMWNKADQIEERAISSEILSNGLSAILGKIKQLNMPYLVRHVHPQRYTLPDTYDRLMDARWNSSSHRMVQEFSETIAKKDGIGLEQATAAVKLAYCHFLTAGLWIASHRRHPGWKPALRKRLETWPALLRMLRSAHTILRPSPDSLKSLRRSNSPFYSDFVLIERIISKKDSRTPTLSMPALDAVSAR